MAKSNLKTLLVALTTSREVDGEKKRVRFKAGSTVDLTDQELEDLTKLEKSTGVLHFRDPINERAKGEEPEVVVERAYPGEDVLMDKKTVDQLKAYLDYYKVEYADNAQKKDLLAAAEAHAETLSSGGDNDQDGGL